MKKVLIAILVVAVVALAVFAIVKLGGVDFAALLGDGEPSAEPSVPASPSAAPSVGTSTEPSAEPTEIPTDPPTTVPTAIPTDESTPADFAVASASETAYDGNLSLFYPVFSGENPIADEAVNEFFRARALDSAEGYEAMLAEEDEWGTQFTLEYNFSIEYAHGSVASVLISIEEFYGGVHPSTQYLGYTVSLAGDGALLSVEDMFEADAHEVREIVLDEVRAQLGDREDLYDDAADAAEESLNFEYSYLSEEGLVVVYQHYELGPYVAGPQFFTISYEKLPLKEEYR